MSLHRIMKSECLRHQRWLLNALATADRIQYQVILGPYTIVLCNKIKVTAKQIF